MPARHTPVSNALKYAKSSYLKLKTLLWKNLRNTAPRIKSQKKRLMRNTVNISYLLMRSLMCSLQL